MSDSAPLKCCTRCKQELPATLEFFYARKVSNDGFRNQCKQCLDALSQARKLEVIPQEKQCVRCKHIYPSTLQYFNRDSHTKDNFYAACRNCTNTTNKHIIKNLPVPEGHKRCMKCEEVYLATDEYFPSIKGVQRNHCKTCVRANAQKNYRNGHPLRQKEILPEGYKRCFTCKEVKPATSEYFDVMNKAKGTFHSCCKPCAKSRRNKVNEKHKIVQYPKGSMKQCSDCKQELPATTDYFHRGNIVNGGLRAICKQCYSVHGKQYEQEHPEAHRAKYNNRRARKKKNGGSFAARDIRRQMRAQKERCYYCNAKLVKYHIDHVIPLSRGGSNDPSNLVLACPSCNMSKGHKLLHEWIQGGRLL